MHMSKTAGVSVPVSSAVVAGYTQPKNTSVKNGCFSMPGKTMSVEVAAPDVAFPLAINGVVSLDGSTARSARGASVVCEYAVATTGGMAGKIG